jgi:hypothetical protein
MVYCQAAEAFRRTRPQGVAGTFFGIISLRWASDTCLTIDPIAMTFIFLLLAFHGIFDNNQSDQTLAMCHYRNVIFGIIHRHEGLRFCSLCSMHPTHRGRVRSKQALRPR